MQLRDKLSSLFSNRTFVFQFVAILILLTTVVIILIVLFISSTSDTTPEPSPSPSRVPTQVRRPVVTQSVQDMQEAQSQADKAYGDRWVETDKNYPWYSKLPLRTNSYFVYFDLSKKVFVAKIYPPRKLDDATKTEITAQLRQIGVNTNQYVIAWTEDRL